MQVAKAAASREHSKVAASFAEKTSVADVDVLVPDGASLSVVAGATAGVMVHSHSVHCAWTLPAASVARTAKTWLPTARPV